MAAFKGQDQKFDVWQKLNSNILHQDPHPFHENQIWQMLNLILFICLYLHFVLFRNIYYMYYQVAVWFMSPYFRRYVMLIVNMTSQYKSTPRRTMNSFVMSYRLCQRFFKIATYQED
jgi:hypothetical protein